MTLAANDEGILTKSFAGLRVLDFSTTIAGPHCTRMLADMGAEVIKIESVEGETMRTRPPVRNGFSTAFGQLNVGKKSLVLDLKSPDAVEIVRRLVVSADIVVENFRPGVMRRLKLDYGSLRELNPKLIYCSISGYRPDRPPNSRPTRLSFMPLRATTWPTCRTSPGDRGRIAAGSITPMSLPASTPSEPFRRRCISGTAVKRVSTSTYRCSNRCSA